MLPLAVGMGQGLYAGGICLCRSITADGFYGHSLECWAAYEGGVGTVAYAVVPEKTCGWPQPLDPATHSETY
jgi:hypothetical protein